MKKEAVRPKHRKSIQPHRQQQHYRQQMLHFFRQASKAIDQLGGKGMDIFFGRKRGGAAPGDAAAAPSCG